MEKISNKEKLKKKRKSATGQPKGLKSVRNNKAKDFKCVKCVIQQYCHFETFKQRPHSVQNKKWNISKTAALISNVNVWQRNKCFPTKLLNGAKRKGSNHPHAVKQLVGTADYYVHMVWTDAYIIPH